MHDRHHPEHDTVRDEAKQPDSPRAGVDSAGYAPVLPTTYHSVVAQTVAPEPLVKRGDRFAAAYAAVITFGAGSLMAVTAVALVSAIVAVTGIHPVLDRGPALTVLEVVALWVAARSYRQVRNP